MKFPVEKILCVVVGVLITWILNYCFSVLVEKRNIGLSRIFRNTPNWTGIIIFFLVLLCAPFFCYSFTWGFIAYNYIQEGNWQFAFLAFAVNVFGVFYTNMITKDIPKRRR